MRPTVSATVDTHIPAAEFKAKCLQLIDEAYEGRQGVVVTKRGVPMARLIPYDPPQKQFRSIIGRTPGGKILGDIVSALPQELTLPPYAWDNAEKKTKSKGKKHK